MNLADLSKIDIKDLQKIDYAKLLQDLKKRPDILISIVFVLATLSFSVNAFTKKKGELSSLQQEVSKLEEKIKVIDSYEAVKKELTDFLANIPEKILENDLINKVTDFAVSRNVQIESYTPMSKQSSPLYDLTSIDLNVSAPDYKNVWLFMNDIEKSKYAIRVENWAGSMDAKGDSRNNSRKRVLSGGAGVASDQPSIGFRLEISAINLKNE